VCHGKKVERGITHLTIHIEKGMADDQRITFPRAGDQRPDWTPGDIIYNLKSVPHKVCCVPSPFIGLVCIWSVSGLGRVAMTGIPPLTLWQVFDRKGVHLYTKLTITLLEALTGFTRTIKHLDGHEVTVERKEVSQPGMRGTCALHFPAEG
jgi:DnaJ-related protein SCJ1